MNIYSPDGQALMTVNAIERDGSVLVIKGKIFGTMPMTARLEPGEARAALKLLKPSTLWLLLTLVFRRSR